MRQTHWYPLPWGWHHLPLINLFLGDVYTLETCRKSFYELTAPLEKRHNRSAEPHFWAGSHCLEE